MRSARRSGTSSFPSYIVAPIFWASTGSVFVFRPMWNLYQKGKDTEDYFSNLPAQNRLDGDGPFSVVRKFTDAEPARRFIASENAYPPRPHFRLVEGSLCETYHRDLPGTPISFPRSGRFASGYDLVDGEGWCRYRDAKPIAIHNMYAPCDEDLVGMIELLSSKGTVSVCM